MKLETSLVFVWQSLFVVQNLPNCTFMIGSDVNNIDEQKSYKTIAQVGYSYLNRECFNSLSNRTNGINNMPTLANALLLSILLTIVIFYLKILLFID